MNKTGVWWSLTSFFSADALNDFDFEDTTKSAIGNAPASASTESAKASKEDSKKELPASSNPIPQTPGEPSDEEQQRWADEFLAKMDSQDPEMKKLMESFASAFGPGATPADGASPSSNSSVPLPNMPEMDFNSPEMAARIADLQKMLADVENGDDDEAALDKILEATGMSKMMEQLMSKEVLLEPFQEMDGQVRFQLDFFGNFDSTFQALVPHIPAFLTLSSHY